MYVFKEKCRWIVCVIKQVFDKKQELAIFSVKTIKITKMIFNLKSAIKVWHAHNPILSLIKQSWVVRFVMPILDTLTLTMVLLPVVFILHDFEVLTLFRH